MSTEKETEIGGNGAAAFMSIEDTLQLVETEKLCHMPCLSKDRDPLTSKVKSTKTGRYKLVVLIYFSVSEQFNPCTPSCYCFGSCLEHSACVAQRSERQPRTSKDQCPIVSQITKSYVVFLVLELRSIVADSEIQLVSLPGMTTTRSSEHVQKNSCIVNLFLQGVGSVS